LSRIRLSSLFARDNIRTRPSGLLIELLGSRGSSRPPGTGDHSPLRQIPTPLYSSEDRCIIRVADDFVPS